MAVGERREGEKREISVSHRCMCVFMRVHVCVWFMFREWCVRERVAWNQGTVRANVRKMSAGGCARRAAQITCTSERRWRRFAVAVAVANAYLGKLDAQRTAAGINVTTVQRLLGAACGVNAVEFDHRLHAVLLEYDYAHHFALRAANLMDNILKKRATIWCVSNVMNIALKMNTHACDGICRIDHRYEHNVILALFVSTGETTKYCTTTLVRTLQSSCNNRALTCSARRYTANSSGHSSPSSGRNRDPTRENMSAKAREQRTRRVSRLNR